MTGLKTLLRAAGLGLCVVAFSGTALADPGNGNGSPPATPPGQEKKAEQAAPAPAPAVAPAPAPAPQAAAPGQQKKAENQAKQAEKKAEPKPAAKPAAKPVAAKPAAKPVAAKTRAPGQVKKAAKPAKTSGSYKDTSSGTDLKKGMSHKHTICHATGSSKNPYVVITPSVSGVFNGHIGHQGDEDIIPPFVYKGTTYSQNWDAAGQAVFRAGCAAPAGSTPLTPAAPSTPPKKDKTDTSCPASATTTERVLVGVWHATGAYKNGQRKFVFITPSAGSAHYDKSKHADDVPVYETRSVSTTALADSCKAATVVATVTPAGPSAPVAPGSFVQPQPVVPIANGTTPVAGTVGLLPAASASQAVGGVAGAVSPANAASKRTKLAKQDKPVGGVLGAVASAPASIAKTATTGTLPFTGIPLWIAALIGGALLAGGIALRRTA